MQFCARKGYKNIASSYFDCFSHDTTQQIRYRTWHRARLLKQRHYKRILASSLAIFVDRKLRGEKKKGPSKIASFLPISSFKNKSISQKELAQIMRPDHRYWCVTTVNENTVSERLISFLLVYCVQYYFSEGQTEWERERHTHTEKKHANNLYSLLRGKGGNQCSFFFPFAKPILFRIVSNFFKNLGRWDSGEENQD